jgi:endonuclease III
MKNKNIEKRKQKAKIIVRELKKLFPEAKTALHYSNAWELLVAVVLSAQCTDKKVNEVTEKLFKKYKAVDDYAKAKQIEFEKDIHSTGFFRNKTKNILASAKIVRDKYQGKIPKTMEELVQLPGVARKTANIVLAVAFGKNEGVAVDTHVKRISVLHGLTDQKNPEKIERDLMEILPRKQWADFNHRMVEYGRKYCPAKKHDHGDCPLEQALKRHS